MKLLLRATMVLICCLAIASPAFAGTFVNGGFETGDFNTWTRGAGYWYGGWPLNPDSYLPGGSNYDMSGNKSGIVTSYLDPLTDYHLNSVYNGIYSARVNDSSPWYHVSVISQTVTNYTNPFIYFAWAAVLESSHESTDSDNFTLQLIDNTTSTALINVTYNSHDNGPLFTQSSSGWFYTAWQVKQLDVSGLQGHDFTLTLLGSDCAYGGHGGYVYLDGFGAAPPPQTTPEPGTLAMLGTGGIFVAGWLRRRFL